MKQIICLTIFLLLFFSCFESEKNTDNILQQTKIITNESEGLNFDKIIPNYIGRLIAKDEKDQTRKQLLLAAKNDENNLFVDLYKAESLIVSEYLYPFATKI